MSRLLTMVPLALLAMATSASAEEVIAKRMAFAERAGNLVVSVGYPELIDSAAYERLSSGFPTTIVIRAWVSPRDREIPISYVIASHQVVYDLWDQKFTVRSSGPLGVSTSVLKKQTEVLRLITRLHRLPIARLDQIAREKHFRLAVVAQLNPVSKELLAEMRRWLTKPAGKAQLDTSSSFFGTFVSVFVNPKLREADRVIRLRSQPFFRMRR